MSPFPVTRPVIVQAVPAHLVPKARQLEGELVESAESIGNHVLTCVTALAEEGDLHGGGRGTDTHAQRRSA